MFIGTTFQMLLFVPHIKSYFYTHNVSLQREWYTWSKHAPVHIQNKILVGGEQSASLYVRREREIYYPKGFVLTKMPTAYWDWSVTTTSQPAILLAHYIGNLAKKKMCSGHNNSGMFALLLHIDLKYVNGNFRGLLISSINWWSEAKALINTLLNGYFHFVTQMHWNFTIGTIKKIPL
jgi:hypothetical protein